LDIGTYRCEARIGRYPDQVWDTDAFTFQIIPDTTSVKDREPRTIPRDFALLGNYPNPFNPTTTLAFNLPRASQVQLAVFDLTGRHVATLVDGWQDAGRHQVIFDASDLSSGIYFYRLQAEEFSAVQKMVLLK